MNVEKAKNFFLRQGWGRNLVLLIVSIIAVWQIIFEFYLASASGNTMAKTMAKNCTPLELETVTKPVVDSAWRMFYAKDPLAFTTELADCIVDPGCKILFLHVQKSGGTFLMNMLGQIDPPIHDRLRAYGKTMKRTMKALEKRPSEVCAYKLQNYEVFVNDYKRVIELCTNLQQQHQPQNSTNERSSSNRRYLGLISVREPMARTMSHIHQICSKNQWIFKQMPERKKACEACDHDGASKQIFDQKLNYGKQIFASMKDLLLNETIRIPLLVVDNSNINDMMSEVEDSVSARLAASSQPPSLKQWPWSWDVKANTESEKTKKKLCDYKMSSAIMKEHRESLEVYGWLWAASFQRSPEHT